MITALKKIYAFSGRWKGVLKKSVVFSLLHSIFDMFQIGALFLILNGLVEGIQRAGYFVLFSASFGRCDWKNRLQLYFRLFSNKSWLFYVRG